MGYEFFKEEIIFPSAPVRGINNDESLNHSNYVVNTEFFKKSNRTLILASSYSSIQSYHYIFIISQL